MRTRARRGPARRLSAAVGRVLLGAVLAGCAEPPPSIAPASQAQATPRPTTQDLHLPDPTTAEAVLQGLGAGGIRVTMNNADAGTGDLVKRVNATFLGWPFAVSEFRTTEALAASGHWTPDAPLAQGDPPVQIAAANILIEWGPRTGGAPAVPNERQVQALADLIPALDGLLSPLRARAVVPVPGLDVGAPADAALVAPPEDATAP